MRKALVIHVKQGKGNLNSELEFVTAIVWKLKWNSFLPRN